MPMVAVAVTRRRSAPEPKTPSSLPVTSCRALTSSPLPISSARLFSRMRNASCPTTKVASAPFPSTIASPGRTTVPASAGLPLILLSPRTVRTPCFAEVWARARTSAVDNQIPAASLSRARRRARSNSMRSSPKSTASLNWRTAPAVLCHAQSPRPGNQPLSSTARGESRRLARLGRGSAQARARGGQADPPLGWILRLPLVSRDGARVLRRPGGGRGDESAVRQRQGGPGGTPGSRSDLSARAPDSRPAAGRLAAHHVPHARRRAFFRRNLFPQRAALQLAGISPAARARRADLPRESGGDRPPERDDSRGLREHAPRRACASLGAVAGADRCGPAQPEDEFRLALRRLRRGAQVSAPRGARVLPAALGRGRRRYGRARRDVHARAHGARGDLRPDRRRVRALQRGRAVDDPALREDALRQRPAASPLLRRLGRYQKSAVRARGRGNRGLGDARNAVPRGRLLLVPRRRLGARGGQVLRLDRAGSPGPAHAGGIGGVSSPLRPGRAPH